MPFKSSAFVIIVVLIFACQQSEPEELDRFIDETAQFPLNTPESRVVTIEQNAIGRLNQTVEVPETAIYFDRFKQQESQPPQVDILIVIDNSGSMNEEQQNLSDKLVALISELKYVDWQINVITTDSNCQRLPDLPITPETVGMDAIFRDAVREGTSGNASERGMQESMDHIEGDCTQDQPWLREEANLAVLVVSDEDEDRSSRYFNKLEDWLLDLEMQNYFAGENLIFYGIIWHPDKLCPTGQSEGNLYAEAIEATGGLWGSICDSDYSKTLNAISADIRLNLQLEFFLRYKPIITTITIDLDGKIYNNAWTVVGQRLIINEPLPPNSTLTISYQTESFRLFYLDVGPEEYILDSLSINGDDIPPEQYKYDAIANSVLLLFDPEPGSIIQTVLRENTGLISSFPFPEVEPRLVSCFVGDDKWEADITVSDGQILLNPTIPEGMSASCLYEI